MNATIAKGSKLAGTREDSDNIVQHLGQQRIIPGIYFGCSGMLNKWIVAAEDKGTGGRRDSYPDLQIWRLQDSSSVYFRVGNSSLQPMRTDTLNVYEFITSPPLQFQAGDVLGLYQPAGGRSALTVYYQEGAGPINYRRENQNGPLNFFHPDNGDFISAQNDLPLIAAEISKYTFSYVSNVSI